MKTSRTNPKKIIEKFKKQTQQYYEGWTLESKKVEKKQELYKHTVDILVGVVREKKILENKPPEVIERIKSIPYEVEIPVPYEVIKEVPYETIKEVPFEVIKEIKVEVPVEVIKEVAVEVPVIKEIVKEIKVFVPTKDEAEEKRYKKQINDLKKERERDINKIQNNFTSQLKLEKLSKKALERRYEVAIIQRKLIEAEAKETYSKSYKRLTTYAYILTMYSLPQLLILIGTLL